MIKFQPGQSVSIIPSVIFSIVIIFCCLTSVILNPIIFFFNSRRKSIAAFLFTILSSIDFLYCFSLLVLLFKNANNVPKDGKRCYGKSEDEYWNCVFTASTGQKVSSAVMHCLDSAAVSTTGLLAIARYIQLKNPLRIIKKKIITLAINLVFAVLIFLRFFSLFSPVKTRYITVYSPMLMLALNANPYNISVGLPWHNQYLSLVITNAGTIVLQIGAIIASILAAAHIFFSMNHFKGRNYMINMSKRRKRGSQKILLTNLPSGLILLRMMMEAPVFSLARRGKSGLYSELLGWIIFCLHRMLPLVASTWNPVIFICFTPKSRELLKKVFGFRRPAWPNSLKRLRKVGVCNFIAYYEFN